MKTCTRKTIIDLHRENQENSFDTLVKEQGVLQEILIESVCTKIADKVAVDWVINEEINNLDVKSTPTAKRHNNEANRVTPTKDNKQPNTDHHKKNARKLPFLNDTIAKEMEFLNQSSNNERNNERVVVDNYNKATAPTVATNKKSTLKQESAKLTQPKPTTN